MSASRSKADPRLSQIQRQRDFRKRPEADIDVHDTVAPTAQYSISGEVLDVALSGGLPIAFKAMLLVAAPVAIFPANKNRINRSLQSADTKIYRLDRIEVNEVNPGADEDAFTRSSA